MDAVSPSLPPSQRSVTETLERLKRLRSARDETEAKLDALVDRAVDLGIGWPEIAAQLGVTRQAAGSGTSAAMAPDRAQLMADPRTRARTIVFAA
ncbi:MAG: hypothetical protein J2P27_01180 [Actinobacteria bacterium]|nr:hypothetical protein [Actinomycetota bacterium]